MVHGFALNFYYQITKFKLVFYLPIFYNVYKNDIRVTLYVGFLNNKDGTLMKFALKELVEDLQTLYKMKYVSYHDTIIHHIELLDSKSLQAPDPETLYLVSLPRMAQLQPRVIETSPSYKINLLCVAQPNTDVNIHALPGNSIVLYHQNLTDILLKISELTFHYGQNTFVLTDVSSALLHCESLPNVMEVVDQQLQCPCVITDEYQRIVSYFNGGADYAGQFAGLQIGKPFEPQAYGQQNQLQIHQIRLASGSTFYGMLYLFSPDIHQPAYMSDLLTILANTCTTVIKRNRINEHISTHDEETTQFLLELLTENILSAQLVEEKQRKLFPYASGEFYLIRIDSEQTGIPYLQNISLHQTAALFDQIYPLIYKEQLFMLTAITDHHTASEVAGIWAKFCKFLKSHNLSAGISNAFFDLTLLRMNYVQACKAIEYGPKLLVSGPIYRYEDCAIYHLIEIATAFHTPISFCSNDLLRLRTYDLQIRGNLMCTLRKYLGSGCNKVYTAKALHVHPNTIKYRIDQINDFLALDVSEPETASRLSFSFKVLDYIDIFC